MASSNEEYLESAGGLRIFIRSWRPDTSPRAVVVLVHGFNSHSGYYLWTAQQLVARGLAVYALDLHGRGQSEGERFYLESMKDYVDDVDAVMMLAKSREPGVPVFLLGHSAGYDIDLLAAVAHRRHRGAAQQCLKRRRHVLGSQSEGAGALLVNLEADCG